MVGIATLGYAGRVDRGLVTRFVAVMPLGASLESTASLAQQPTEEADDGEDVDRREQLHPERAVVEGAAVREHLPAGRPDDAQKPERRQIFVAKDHDLVDPEARQRPPDPNHHEDQHEGLQDEYQQLRDHEPRAAQDVDPREIPTPK